MSKRIYSFGGGAAEGHAGMKNLLGGKGANLAEMASLGLPVPPGFTITTEVCTSFYANGRQYPDGLREEVAAALAAIEKETGKTFGDPGNPLLVSVRSGGRASMPGMMDTVLNLGLNDETVEGLADLADDDRFAQDSYRRFIQMYGDVVLGVPHYRFEEILDEFKDEQGVFLDTELDTDHWREVITRYKAAVEEELGEPFPQDPQAQLWGAIDAVFGSWMNERSKTYRRLNDIPEEWGTAVNVQAMVFGNMGETSATGVAFTRNPSTGENAVYGEFLINAQGEDVVAGIRTPGPLTKAAREAMGGEDPSLEEAMPETFAELRDVFARLEAHYRDMQDIEFTIEEGRLYILQTRNGKRTAGAALKIAVDLAEGGVISEADAVGLVDPLTLDQLLHPSLDPDAPRDLLTRGLPASPGAASGQAVFSAERAEAMKQNGTRVILVRMETSPEDIGGMHAAEGILTARGGMTSHAAVVARGMGRPCVCGAGDLRLEKDGSAFIVGGRSIKEGDLLTLDGATGEVFVGEIPSKQPEMSGDFATLMAWADGARRLGVRANAETAADAAAARKFGAEGIGLCRTEHMFFEEDRILAVREMILAETEGARRAALDKLLPVQRADFVALFREMAGLPVTIRLLDPPLHEFLPHTDEDIAAVAEAAGASPEAFRRRATELTEANPMLGHRGCRLGLTYPEIYEMQVRAILEAACDVAKETGEAPVPEIMVPLVSMAAEIKALRVRIDDVAAKVFKEKSRALTYLVGTMIELPRAALTADEIAGEAAFFSFGTNDLTQTTFGISRDDAGGFMPHYLKAGLAPADPFVSLDRKGVGALMSLAAEKGRATRPELKLGICGEQGGDPNSIRFFEELRLDYVSCSPYRVPIARLAAAQAAQKPRKV